MGKILITEVELKRHRVLSDVLEGIIDLRTASELFGLSYRHTIRLKERFKAEGGDGLLRRKPQVYRRRRRMPKAGMLVLPAIEIRNN
jgi:transposase